MRLRLDNLHAHVVSATPSELAWLDAYLTYTAVGYGGKKVKRGLLDRGVTPPQFPAGLRRLVTKAAVLAGQQVVWDDQQVMRRTPATTLALAETQTMPETIADRFPFLRPHQRAAFLAVLREHRGVLCHGTGSGKSVIAAALVGGVRVNWLVLVPGKSLLGQFADEIAHWTLERPGIIGDGDFETGHRVTVATYQSLVADLKCGRPQFNFNEVDGVVIDELHGSAATDESNVLLALPNAWWRCGLSATPYERLDHKGLMVMAHTGPVIHRATVAELVVAGMIAQPMVHILRAKSGSHGTTWDEVHARAVVYNHARNGALLSALRIRPRPWLVFVRTLEHGTLLEREWTAAGVPTRFVHGTASVATRQQACNDLVNGTLACVVATRVFYQGIDVPSLRTIGNAAGGSSMIDCVQRAGRGSRLRDKSGAVVKTVFDVLDFDDVGCGCRGSAHRACGWLSKHSAARHRAYTKAGFIVVDA